MQSEHEEFDQIRKLLALKKYELPPPRYFQEFSGKVIARLQSLAVQPVSWRQRFGLDFEFHPAMMGAFGVVVCGLLLVGVISSSGGSQSASPELVFAPDPSEFISPPSANPVFAGGVLPPLVRPEEISGSTLPVTSDSPFSHLVPRGVQRTAFSFGSGN